MTDTGDVLAPGTRLDDLEIERMLGAGGFGVTYLARDLSLDVKRAVKEYLPRNWGTRQGDGTIGPRTELDVDDYQWGLERFLVEARMLARFDHRHLVRVYRVFEARGTAYLVMEYLEGRTLKKEVEASGPLPEARMREILAALTDGLAEVHEAELLHRDIKPENVMVRPDGTPVLVDFGSARQAMGVHSQTLTAVLTPGFAPFEQYSPRGHQGPWTDIYALGAVAYWALSGKVPEEATLRVRADRLPPVAQVARVGVSARLAAAVDAALAVNEADRPQSLEEWRDMLDRRPVKPPEIPPQPPQWQPQGGFGGGAAAKTSGRRRRLGVVAAVAVVAALVVTLAFVGNWFVSEQDRNVVEDVSEKSVVEANGDTPTVNSGTGLGVKKGKVDPVDLVVKPDDSKEIETSLRLNRAQKRAIQKNLAAAGFDPGGADGVFGPDTRAALRAWQKSQGIVPTGYLTATIAASLLKKGGGNQAARKGAASVVPELRSGAMSSFRGGPTCAGQPKDSSCWMKLSDKPNCYVWNLILLPGGTVSWTGECSSNLAQGKGTLTWFDDSRKETWDESGGLQDGRRHGQWVQRTSGGGVLQGMFAQGKKHGQWIARFANGTVWQGPYVEGEKHGQWIERRGDGAVDEGPYVEGKKHGQWVERTSDGNVLEGPYVEGKEHGQWTLRLNDGGLWQGPYVEGERHGHWIERMGDGAVDEGPYVEGKEHGQWVERTSDGNVLEGPYVEGKEHGQWTVRWNDGDLWQGPYVEGKQHGRWVSRTRDGKVLEANFVGGERQGDWTPIR